MQSDLFDDGLRDGGLRNVKTCSVANRFRQRFGCCRRLLCKLDLECLRRIGRVDGKLADIGVEARQIVFKTGKLLAFAGQNDPVGGKVSR